MNRRSLGLYIVLLLTLGCDKFNSTQIKTVAAESGVQVDVESAVEETATRISFSSGRYHEDIIEKVWSKYLQEDPELATKVAQFQEAKRNSLKEISILSEYIRDVRDVYKFAESHVSAVSDSIIQLPLEAFVDQNKGVNEEALQPIVNNIENNKRIVAAIDDMLTEIKVRTVLPILKKYYAEKEPSLIVLEDNTRTLIELRKVIK